MRIAPCLSVVIQRGYIPGKIAGRVGNAVDGCGFAARIVKHGKQFRAVLVEELSTNHSGRQQRGVAHSEKSVEVELAVFIQFSATTPDNIGVSGIGVQRTAADIQFSIIADAVDKRIAQISGEIPFRVADATVRNDDLREGVTEKGRKLFGMRIEICETGWSAVHKLRVGGGYVGHDLGRKRSVDAVTVFGCVIVEFPAESPFEIDARAMLVSIVETWTGREGAKAVEEQAVGVYGIVHDLYICEERIPPKLCARAWRSEHPCAMNE